MQISVTACLLIILLQLNFALGIWNFWKFAKRNQHWRRNDDMNYNKENSHGVSGAIFVSMFGYPSNCLLKGTFHSCTLSVACWWAGGTSQSGCGTSSWIVACCVRKDDFDEEKENYVIPSIQRRNAISNAIDTGCGISNDRIMQKRIIGGDQAKFAQFPWQAYIKISSYQCGGVLVSRKFVATAAHCILPAKLAELSVYLGDLDVNDTGEVEELAPAELHRVKKRLIHPKFRYKATQPDRYDLALLELITEAGFNFHISPICLPSGSIQLIGREAVVAGWGKIDPKSKKTGTNILRSVQVPILDINDCMSWHKTRQIALELHPEMLCAGFEMGKQDACLGDSGGPLILLENGRWTLVGITSAGFGCGEPHQPGIYHKVPMSVDWIKSVIYDEL